MNSIDFSQGSGDFQLDKRTFEYMQEAYTSLNVLGMLLGTENTSTARGYILSGVQNTDVVPGTIPENETGTAYTAGYLYIDGEVVKFQSGINTSNTIVPVTSNPILGTPHDSKYTDKVYKFGAGVGEIPFAQIKRVPKLMEASFIDEIRIFGGSVANLPLGWYICDGTNGTVDMGGRFPIGYQSSYTQGQDSVDYRLEDIGYEGGSKDVALSTGQMPPHTHDYKDIYHSETDTQQADATVVLPGTGVGSGDTDTANKGMEMDRTTESSGEGQKHTNMPPYKVVYYIQYKGYVRS